MVQDADNCSGDDDRYQSSAMSLLVLLLLLVRLPFGLAFGLRVIVATF
ncbi:hypothetical protein HanPI659440_Chr15g0594811 [Helianthus annuus]|nr:hypothetical protein HanPI659440_Chr15g0594811 [Helianthus annuus]